MATLRKHGKAWQAIVRRKGVPIQRKTFPKKALAQAWARKTEELLLADAFITVTASKMTVEQMMSRHYQEITPRKKSAHIEKYRVVHLSNFLGSYTLEKLSPSAVIEYVDMRLQSVTGVTVRKELALLSQAIDTATALWDVKLISNPVQEARKVLKVTKTLKPENKRERRPTDEELHTLYDSLTGLLPQIVEYAIETGMRRGEIAKQHASHRNGNILHIPETKTDEPRTIILSTRACEILDSLPLRDDGNIWGYTAESITGALRRACKKLEIEDLHFHDLRHKAASRFFEVKGLNVAEVAKITGQTFATLERYTHLRAENLVAKLG